MKLGNAKYGGGSFVKRKYFRLKDGEASFRILPPMGELADKGIWSQYYNVHFGYRNSKDQLRPFQSPLVKNNKTKMIEVPDAALERIQKLKGELDTAKKSGNTAAAEQLEKLVGFKGRYSLDNNHYMNVIDSQGNIGVLQIRHRCKLVLDAEIKRLRETGIDPLSVDDGRFFIFRRTGNGLDTSFSVSILKEKLNISGVGSVERDVVHKLTEDVIGRLSSEAAELHKLFKKPTSQEVARIVAEGARAVDEILDARATETVAEDFEGLTEEPVHNASGVTESTTITNTPNSVSNVTITTNTPNATGGTVTVTSAVPASTVGTGDAAKIAEMSEDEFLKSLGL